MSYSPIQLSKARAALEKYKRFGNGIPGQEFSWVQMIGEIELYTDYSILRPRQKGEDLERLRLKDDAEALRQFVRGGMNRATKFRAISMELMAAIFRFLTHDEIRLLSEHDFVPDEVPLILAESILDFVAPQLNNDEIDSLFGCHESWFRGVSFAPSNEVESMARKRDHTTLRPALSYNYAYLKESHSRRVRLMEYITISSFWNLAADQAASQINGTGPRRLSSKVTGDSIETTYTGVAIVLSANSAICLLKDSAGVLVKNLWITKSTDSKVKSSIIAVDLSRNVDDSPKWEASKLLATPSIFESSDVRRAFLYSPLRNVLNSLTYVSAAIFEPVADDYYFLDEYVKDVMKLWQSFDPNPISPVSGRRSGQQEQQNLQDVECLEVRRSVSKIIIALRDYNMNTDEKTIDLLIALQRREFDRIPELYLQGARLNFPDSKNGMNALHVIASMGWREGITIALKDKDRCNFAQRDNRGNLASYHALVYGRDPVSARLLRFIERKQGVVDQMPARGQVGPRPQ